MNRFGSSSQCISGYVAHMIFIPNRLIALTLSSITSMSIHLCCRFSEPTPQLSGIGESSGCSKFKLKSRNLPNQIYS
ncbi:hypothetical protein D918_04854 [Trichuris suis]|nr:hypothetical protein D918_04854 [Trichuris suis]